MQTLQEKIWVVRAADSQAKTYVLLHRMVRILLERCDFPIWHIFGRPGGFFRDHCFLKADPAA